MLNVLAHNKNNPKEHIQPWREYVKNSPIAGHDGKKPIRPRINKIPFKGKVTDIRAQGTKVVPSFSMYNNNYVYFQAPSRVVYFGKRLKDFTDKELAALSDAEIARLQREEDRRDTEETLATTRNARANYRATLDSSREARGWTRLARDLVTPIAVIGGG